MNAEEVFVGAVSVLLGLVALIAAVSNNDWCYSLPKVRWLSRHTNRTTSRCIYGVLGLLLIAWGIAICFGFGPNKGDKQRGGDSPNHNGAFPVLPDRPPSAS